MGLKNYATQSMQSIQSTYYSINKLNYFMIGEVSSLDYGVIISKAGVYNAPARVYEAVSVPGRNGDVLFDEGRYENVTVTYEAALLNKNANLDGFRAWLSSFVGYVRIEDTYHPEEYRLGFPSDGILITTEAALKIGRFTVSFNCKPQRFLKSGEIKSRYTTDITLFNPTRYEAKPLIRVYGYGILGVGNDTVTINTHALDYIDLDCSLCDAFCGSSNANNYVSLSGDDYPSLGVGKTGITLGSNITAIEVWPHWWTL